MSASRKKPDSGRVALVSLGQWQGRNELTVRGNYLKRHPLWITLCPEHRYPNPFLHLTFVERDITCNGSFKTFRSGDDHSLDSLRVIGNSPLRDNRAGVRHVCQAVETGSSITCTAIHLPAPGSCPRLVR